MNAAIFTILLLGFATLIIYSPASVRATAGTPPSWTTNVDCYGPFPLPPVPGQSGYNKTEKDTFNATLDGKNMGGVDLSCGPVLQGTPKQSASGKFVVSGNSTGLRWHEENGIIPQDKNFPPSADLSRLLHNFTELVHRNENNLFANFKLSFVPPPEFVATLECNPDPTSTWQFVFNVSFVYTGLGGGRIPTIPDGRLSCTNSSPTQMLNGSVTAQSYYDFHLRKDLYVNYSAGDQPSNINRTTNVDNNLLDRAVIRFVPGTALSGTPLAAPQIVLTLTTVSVLLAILARKRFGSHLRRIRNPEHPV